MRLSTLPRNSSRPRQRRLEHQPTPGPRHATLKKIMDYSRALRVVDAPPLGQVDVILN